MVSARQRFVLGTLGLACGWLAPGQSLAQEAEPDVTVLLTNIEFKPNRIQVSVGDTVRFINRDQFDHDVYLVRTANRNDVIHAATTLHPGQSVTVTIDQEGLFTLYCTIHGGMTGKVTTTGTFELTEEEKKRAAARHVIPPIVKTGEELYWGRAQCHRCHMVGDRGTNQRGPNHQDLGFRAAARAQKFGLSSATEYIVQSIMEPSAHIVEGYTDDMPNVFQPPINLGEEDIKALVAYLQSQGGDVDTWVISINQQILARKLPESPFRRGDPKRGKAVFEDMGCRSCHTVGAQKAISVAPELTAIGAFRNWTWLAQAVVEPNAEIGANWKDATVFLKPGVTLTANEAFVSHESFEEEEFSDEDDAGDAGSPNAQDELALARAEMSRIQERIHRLEEDRAGPTGADAAPAREVGATGQTNETERPPGNTTAAEAEATFEYGESVPGILRKNSAEEVTLLIAPDQFASFPRDQIAGVRMSRASRMAANYGELMTFQQFADLIRYLESLKGPDEPSNTAMHDGPNAERDISTTVGGTSARSR